MYIGKDGRIHFLTVNPITYRAVNKEQSGWYMTHSKPPSSRPSKSLIPLNINKVKEVLRRVSGQAKVIKKGEKLNCVDYLKQEANTEVLKELYKKKLYDNYYFYFLSPKYRLKKPNILIYEKRNDDVIKKILIVLPILAIL